MTAPDVPSPAVSALITDLDGTFWSTRSEVHAASLAAIDAVDAANIPFVIATGRRAQGTLLGLRPYGLHNRPGILMNGALARDRLDGESFLVEAIALDDAKAVLTRCREGDLEPVAYVDHPETDMLVGPGGAAGADYLARTVGYAMVDSLDASLPDNPVIGFGAFGFKLEKLQPICDAINEAGLATAIIGESLYEGNYGLMVQAHQIDKQTGIDAWCRRNSIDPTRLAVVGDGHNDIEMLRNAHIAIVPESAAPEIRELADVVIGRNEDGGWEQLPEILGL